ncbi:hypothetical protein DPMN_059994 [Dreissena polymorpha]|uniref:Uncharacterized protein n=1 Tax=Dreissena polymorpha TaxID=45954 RepID=A0A9D4HH54_DREPO|nr:hypothetical protein DPMN_059994 [Dreissena polymorpha]
MLTLDHGVDCELLNCDIASDDFDETLLSSDMSWYEEDEKSDMSITTDLNNTCMFDINDDSPGLWETLDGLNVNNLRLGGGYGALTVHLVSSKSRSLESLPKLETLSMNLSFYIDLPLPPYLKHLTVLYNTLSPSELRHLVNQLCAFTHSVECKLEFLCGNKIENNTITNIPPENYITVEQELQTLEHVEVKRFRIYDRTPQTDINYRAAWSVRDSIVDDGDHGDDIGKDEGWISHSSHSDIRKWHSECLNRISLQLRINGEQNN